MPMHELVHSSLHSRLLAWLRLPSFAGDGLPERMRSTTFALLGLTAAGGLALVAIFAQPGFPLLTPAPLPAEPSLSESIAGAEKAVPGQRLVPQVPVKLAHFQGQGGGSVAGSPSPSLPGDAGTERSSAPTGADVPTPSGTPETPAEDHQSGGADTAPGGGSNPVPTAVPEPATASPSAPVSAPQPATPPPPHATASVSTPAPAPAPGNSASAAAAAHASERGIEASAAPGPPTASASEAPVAPGNGNGLAKGHYK